jgi:alanine racemase
VSPFAPHRRPTLARIDLAALRHNGREVLKRTRSQGLEVLAAVKADAYGHGLVPVAKVLAEVGVDWLGVAIVEEGLQLREAGVDLPILVLGGVGDGAEEVALGAQITPVLYRERSADRLAALARDSGKTVDVHIKVDTGMNRLGVPLRDLSAFLDHVERLSGLRIDGVMTHLAEAETGADGMTSDQLERFGEAVSMIRGRGHSPRWVHAANSAALLTGQGGGPELGASLVRPGIMLYGATPTEGLAVDWGFAPVLTFETAVSFLKEVPVGSTLSYGATWRADRPSRIATLPVGYGDGYSRSLGNRADVLIRGQRAPLVGRVCMDLCLVDVTDIADVCEGDPVVLLGRQGECLITASELALHQGTISYEVLCSIAPRVPRVYCDGEGHHSD